MEGLNCLGLFDSGINSGLHRPCFVYTYVYNSWVADRRLSWVGTSLSDTQDFPDATRRVIGYQLRRVQQGLMPSDWKPMSSVGGGVIEIRVHSQTEHRVLYVAKFQEAVYVLHAFEKKSRRSRKADLDLARSRLKEVEANRKRRGENR